MEIAEKLEKKKKMQAEFEAQMEMEEQEEEYPDEVEMQQEVPEGKRKSKVVVKKKGCCAAICPSKPECLVRLSNKLEVLAEHPFFEKFIIILILINTACLASEFYDSPDWINSLLDMMNLFFTVVFAMEMIIKMSGFGFRKYYSDKFNIFDCFIVIMSYVELLMPGDNSSLSVLRAFRLLRIFKIIKSWDSLRILLSTVLDSMTAITNLGVLIMLFLFISALLMKQFYQGELIDDEWEVSRYSYSTTGSALINVFILLTGEAWTDQMIIVMV